MNCDADRTRWLTELAPDLFTPDWSVLYIGASKDRCDYLGDFRLAGSHVYVLEAWPPNVERVAADNPWLERVYCRDVRQGVPVFVDVVFWWHGPEHVTSEELGAVLADLELHAERMVVLGAPWGDVAQGPIDGNRFESHVGAIRRGDLEKYGYTVRYGGTENVCGSSIVAVKRLA